MGQWLDQNWYRLLIALVWLLVADDVQGGLGRGWPHLVLAVRVSFQFTGNVWGTPWRWIAREIWPTCLSLARKASVLVRQRLAVPGLDQREVLVGGVVAGVLLVMAAADAVVLGYSLAVTGMANEILPIGSGLPVAPVLAVILALYAIGAGVALGRMTEAGRDIRILAGLVLGTIAGGVAVSFLRGWVVLDNAPEALRNAGTPMRLALGFMTALIAAGLAGGEFEMARRLHEELVTAGLRVLHVAGSVAGYLAICALWLIALGLAVDATVAVACGGVLVALLALVILLVPVVVACAVTWAATMLNWVPFRLHHWLRIFFLRPR